MTSRPISDYGLLGDCHSAALVSTEGSIDWLCAPRFDAPSIFGRILDDEAGHWSIRPRHPFRSERSYVEGSLVLATRLATDDAVLTVTDALLFAHHVRGHDVGDGSPHVLVRELEADRPIEVVVEFSPRPEYGLVRPTLDFDDGALTVIGGATRLVLDGPAPDVIADGSAHWDLRLEAGGRVTFAMHVVDRGDVDGGRWSAPKRHRNLYDTIAAWQSWSDLHLQYEGHARDLVHLSGRVLYAMSYKPTGAIVAAPTTSLPEQPGGTRNWDYRYAWIRDTSLTLNALWIAACPHEAERYVRFLVDTAGTALTQDHGIQIMYGIGGEHDLTERELGHLAGWADSRPVRVGNGAWNQAQIDIFGELLDAVHRLHDQFVPSPSTCQFLVQVADAAADAWSTPDSGIWETRGPPRHYVYSKLMCWLALDRAVELADWLGAPERAPGWRQTADAIRGEILDRGWNAEIGAFTQAFDEDGLDAAVLFMAMSGFLPLDDERLISTVDAIACGLAAPSGLLYRYRTPDGVGGGEAGEGLFLLCTFWLSSCRSALGQPDEARALFDLAVQHVNDLGLLSEEVDADTGALLGNFPQALSHVGLVNAAWAISEAATTP